MPKALRVIDLKQVQLAGRELVYGFSRMNIDGHFPRWGVADAERTAEGVIDLFIDGTVGTAQRSSDAGGKFTKCPGLGCKFIAYS